MRRKLLERRTPREWNIRALTEEDFWQCCDEAKIVVREAPLEQPGYSLICDGARHIFVHEDLRGAHRLFALWHELAHHWLHPERVQFFRGRGDQNIEIEANIVAACAMIPRTMLIHYEPSEISDLHGYPDWIIRIRQEVLEEWGI